MSTPNTYPAQLEPQGQRASDILAREVPFGEAVDFVHGCQVFAEVIGKESPDIVLFPQRGAGPIEWTTEVIMEESGKRMPLFVDLPLGTHLRINEPLRPDGKPHHSGISGKTKQEIVEATIEQLQDEGIYVPGKSRLMLIDEVQKGGTITQAAQAIKDAMERRGDTNALHVVAAQDSRHHLIGEQRTESYRKLAGNERAGFKTVTSPISLFMVDRPQFLDEIWKTTGETETFLEDYIINENDAARRMFRTLAKVYLHPSEALDEIEELHRHIIAEDIGTTILQSELLEALTDPHPVKNGKHATEAHLFEWWKQFAQKLHHKSQAVARPAIFEPVQ